MHRHWHTDARQRAHVIGQGETHKYTKRDAETETPRDIHMKGEARYANRH